MPGYERSPRSAFAEWRQPDVVRKLFGVQERAFVDAYLGREPLVAHGPVRRFEDLLGRALIPGQRALAKLMPDYSQVVRRVVFDQDGVLHYEKTAAVELAGLPNVAKGCYFLYDYDGHFRGPRLLLDALCPAFGYARRGANCRGSFQTRGAFVPRHCDEVDVVILQLIGTRRWRIERNSEPPVGIHDPVRLPAEKRGGWSVDFGPSSRVLTLRSGSALYVPHGWWHETRSAEASFAITIGVIPKSPRLTI
jgi:ribosomal protein L16 Arg81 hydroxylase